MKEIKLTKGKVTIVDDEDFEKLNLHKWRCDPKGYARRNGIRPRGSHIQPTIAMAREIMAAQPGEVVDHINNNPLDNRKSNLRVLKDKIGNFWNRRVPKRGGATQSKYIGVQVIKGRFSASIQSSLRKQRLGTYATAEEAARAYDKAAKEIYGEFAKLNFPEEENK